MLNFGGGKSCDISFISISNAQCFCLYKEIENHFFLIFDGLDAQAAKLMAISWTARVRTTLVVWRFFFPPSYLHWPIEVRKSIGEKNTLSLGIVIVQLHFLSYSIILVIPQVYQKVHILTVPNMYFKT